jgi:hypothetical protein
MAGCWKATLQLTATAAVLRTLVLEVQVVTSRSRMRADPSSSAAARGPRVLELMPKYLHAAHAMDGLWCIVLLRENDLHVSMYIA